MRILDTGGLVIKHTWLSHTLYQAHNVPYTAKLLRVKTFAVVHKTHFTGNFRGASGPCHYVLYMESDSRGKLS